MRAIRGHGFIITDETMLLERADCWFTPTRQEFVKKLVRNDFLKRVMIRNAGRKESNVLAIKQISA